MEGTRSVSSFVLGCLSSIGVLAVRDDKVASLGVAESGNQA